MFHAGDYGYQVLRHWQISGDYEKRIARKNTVGYDDDVVRCFIEFITQGGGGRGAGV